MAWCSSRPGKRSSAAARAKGKPLFAWGEDWPGPLKRARAERIYWELPGTRPVGSGECGRNEIGVEDFAGQVLEWLADARPHHGVRFQLMKGASWFHEDPLNHRVASGWYAFEGWRSAFTGFRCALDATEDPPPLPTSIPATAVGLATARHRLSTAPADGRITRSTDGFYALAEDREKGFSCKALSYYHRQDGTAVGIWKDGFAALSTDAGHSWSSPVKLPSMPVHNAKAWGQRTDDGRFVMVYNPMPSGFLRWPLAVITGEDGICFDHMLAVHTEVPPMRFSGRFKDRGPQYVRGILEGNGTPPAGFLPVICSMNKEDLWI